MTKRDTLAEKANDYKSAILNSVDDLLDVKVGVKTSVPSF